MCLVTRVRPFRIKSLPTSYSISFTRRFKAETLESNIHDKRHFYLFFSI